LACYALGGNYGLDLTIWIPAEMPRGVAFARWTTADFALLIQRILTRAAASRADADHNRLRGRVSPSRMRQTFDPVEGPQDVGIGSEILFAFARSKTEKMTALLVPDGASDTLCEKGKLFVRGLFDRLLGSPVDPGSALADQSLLFL
jgi:hypothetical protein